MKKMYAEEIKKMYADDMTVKDYKKILDRIIKLSFDADGFALDGYYDNDEIEKCKLIREMIEVLMDVPNSRCNWILDEAWRPMVHKMPWFNKEII